MSLLNEIILELKQTFILNDFCLMFIFPEEAMQQQKDVTTAEKIVPQNAILSSDEMIQHRRSSLSLVLWMICLGCTVEWRRLFLMAR